MDVKEQIRKSGIKQYEIAERINVSEFTFSRWMRKPEKLSNEKIKDISAAIKEIQDERRI